VSRPGVAPCVRVRRQGGLRIGPDGKALTNYWGYSTVSFFARTGATAKRPGEGCHVAEFRDLVKALHKAGIEIILDVVFNHKSEGNHLGPMINLRGFDNRTYYHLVVGNSQYYMDYSGCGNTVNCNHPVVRKFILDCLRFWVEEMHVDGFRFDEGSILSRGEDGRPMEHAPVLWDLELDDTFAGIKLIAEAWDASGLYQIGCFPGFRWAEWNGRYRDDVRRFVKGDPASSVPLHRAMGGSADIYQPTGHSPVNSINFVNCHDGFTLYDTVSYNQKHNWENGEGNGDGVNENLSWNCGAEGPTDDASINALRLRQVRNFATILLLSRGVPMFVAGDEVGRTQRGNNNAYCQDNELSWFDWSLLETNADLLRFFQRMIAFRKQHPLLRQPCFLSDRVNERGLPEVSWHGTRLNAPGWSDASAQALACTFAGFDGAPDIHVILNMCPSDLAFELPRLHGRRWLRVVDTSLPAPKTLRKPGAETPIPDGDYACGRRSCVVLIASPRRRVHALQTT
jgi:glycogen operon protein